MTKLILVHRRVTNNNIHRRVTNNNIHRRVTNNNIHRRVTKLIPVHALPKLLRVCDVSLSVAVALFPDERWGGGGGGGVESGNEAMLAEFPCLQ